MPALTQEVRFVQNPALGSVLLWRFVCSYQEAHSIRSGVPLPICYIVLPIILHEGTRAVVKSTLRKSGLSSAVAKFSESNNPRQDILLALHDRALRLRNLSTKSLGLAISKQLLHLGKDGLILPLTTTQANTGLAPEVKMMMNESEKLGAWFSELTIHEVSVLLKVRF